MSAAAGTAPTVAVVGRANVGKSTLVNRLVGRREAIVQERPGVTRDRAAYQLEWRGRQLVLVDTGGWLPGRDPEADDLRAAVTEQASLAARTADLVLLVVDATVGITEDDAAVADRLRAAGLPVVLVANKVDALGGGGPRPSEPLFAAELAGLYGLGLGEPFPVSALHGRGSGDLLDVIHERLEAAGAFERPAASDEADIPGVALIGRPNVGKSSLFNRLVGEQRAIVHDRPGTTRDAVDSVVRLPDGRVYRFVDTAGLRRKSGRGASTEYYSTVRTVRALQAASAALLVIDGADAVGEQEQRLARQVVDAGRALVLVVNKWDLVDDYRRGRLERERDRLLRFVDWAPIVRTSASSGRGVERLPTAVDAVLAEWRRRVPTGQLNAWLAEVTAASPPPMQAGRSVRARYVTQVAVGPPTFRVFTSGQLAAGYVRYLERRLRESFGFRGTPLHVGVRVRARWEQRGTGSTPATDGRAGRDRRGRPRR